MGDAVYDRIGRGYTTVRRPDPRIEERIWSALAGASRVVNVGAGTGSYERAEVAIAVEPSLEMIGQRGPGTAPVVRAVAEHLPFAAGSFDAATALLTVHHWGDPRAGLAELRRVTDGPIVVFTFDKVVHDHLWLHDYLPEGQVLDDGLLDSDAIADALGGGRVEPVPVPHDCVDGFAHAYWRRPEAYLDPAVRAGISTFARLPADVVARAVARLDADLASGRWADEHADLLELDEVDAGYRLVVVG
jgi:SAM-dependent methyltransferase